MIWKGEHALLAFFYGNGHPEVPVEKSMRLLRTFWIN